MFVKPKIAILFALVSLLLSACSFTIEGTVDFDLPPNFTISNAQYTTNHGNSNGVFEICENKSTRLTYEFNFSGGNPSWIEYINFYDNNGVFTSRFTPNNISVISQTGNFIEVAFDIPARTNLANQAIDLKVGEAQFFLEFNGASRPYRLFAQPINVIASC